MMSKVGSTSKDKFFIFGEEQYMQLVIQTEEKNSSKTRPDKQQRNSKFKYNEVNIKF